MAGLGVGILLTGFAFSAVPAGFVPTEDQGYGIGFVIAPEGTSNRVTDKLNTKLASILRTEPEIEAAAFFSGASLDGFGPNRGLFFFGVKNWDDRPGKDQTMAAITQRLNQKIAAEVDEARVFVVEPPSIPGYGASAGFEFQLLDQSAGSYSMNEFAGAAGQIIKAANADPVFNKVYTQFIPDSPQLRIDVDRERMAALGVDFGQAMEAFSVNFGGRYVNDTFQEGKVRRVYVQSGPNSRADQAQLGSIYVRNGTGELIPLSEFFSVRQVSGPSIINRFNLFRSIKIEGAPAPGNSSGQAINGIQEIFKAQNMQGLGYDWTGISREEVKAGALAVVIFAMGILVVYLVLSAQYESYTDPLIILMTVPTAMLGALVFLSGAGQVLNIYAQVGLVMLIGLAAGNGILIVDLANQRMGEGLSALAAATDAAKSRLRPILMTAISSLFGFLPLMLASGAGAQSQASLGLVVFGGLAVATVLSTVVVPVFYVVMKTLLGQAEGRPDVA